MKYGFFVLCFIATSSLFANPWYGYCVVEKGDTHICTSPEVKTDDLKSRCMAFASEVGARNHSVQVGEDLEELEAEMAEHCDEIQGPQAREKYTCQYVTRCGNDTQKINNLSVHVEAYNTVHAMNRCVQENSHEVIEKLTKVSNRNCYLKLLVQKVK